MTKISSVERMPLLRRRRQRNRLFSQRREVSNHVGALAVLLDAGEAHRSTRDKALRVVDELAEIVIGPGAAFGLHGGGEIEVTALALLVADDAVKIRADAVGAVLFEGMAGAAFLGGGGTLLDRGGLQQLFDRLGGRGRGFLGAAGRFSPA